LAFALRGGLLWHLAGAGGLIYQNSGLEDHDHADVSFNGMKMMGNMKPFSRFLQTIVLHVCG
jgi:hypothetical protein